MWLSLLVLLLLISAEFWLKNLHGAYVPGTYVQPSLTIAIALALIVFVDRFIRRHYWHGYLKQRRNREAPAVLKDIVTLVLLLLGLGATLAWLQVLSFSTLLTAIIATSGVATVAASTALAPVFQDLFGGVAINLDHSYALGDWLTVYSQDPPGTIFGRVAGITWRTTHLILEDGTQLAVPNRAVALNPLMNHSQHSQTKMVSLAINVDNRVPAHRVINLLRGEVLKLVREPGFACSPAPVVTVSGLIDTNTMYEVRLHIHPDHLLPREASSIALQTLQDITRRAGFPAPVAHVEIRRPPANAELSFGQDEIIEALSRVPLFCDALTPEQAKELAGRCTQKTIDENQDLILQGEQASSLFIILEGAAKIWISKETESCKEVAVLAMGDVVGEMSLLTGAPRNATVTALTHLHVLEITKHAIAELVNKSPEILVRFSEILLRRRRELQELADQALGSHGRDNDLLARIQRFFFSGTLS